jgi:hypothetical protein
MYQRAHDVRQPAPGLVQHGGALRTAIEPKPSEMTITIADIGSTPLHNEAVRVQWFPPVARNA